MQQCMKRRELWRISMAKQERLDQPAGLHVTNEIAQQDHGLRRAVGVWGSYTWGYADVGADIYVALGIVMAAAQGATNVAFLFAGLVYVMVGLAYTELAAAYPMAGG